MFVTVRLTLHSPDCSRISGFKSSLKQVHLRIHHAVGLTSYLTGEASMDSFRRSTSIIFTNPPAGAGRSSKKVFISGIYIPHRPAHYDHGCGETNYSAQSQTQKNNQTCGEKSRGQKTRRQKDRCQEEVVVGELLFLLIAKSGETGFFKSPGAHFS